MAFLVPLFVVALLVVAATWLWDFAIVRLIWRPYSIYKEFREQGIHGPPYKFIKGSKEDIKIMREQKDNFVLDVRTHNYLPRIAPHYLKWRSQYGKPYLLFFSHRGLSSCICTIFPLICFWEIERRGL
jgi:cytochrome P450 family 709